MEIFRWLGYIHSPGEIFFPDNGYNYTICSTTNGEDPLCSAHITDLVHLDHDHYLDIYKSLQDGHGCGIPKTDLPYRYSALSLAGTSFFLFFPFLNAAPLLLISSPAFGAI